MLGGELLPQGPRASGMSFGCLTNWLTNFCIAIGFPLVQSALNQHVFLIFAAATTALGLLVYFKLPETKISSNSGDNNKFAV